VAGQTTGPYPVSTLHSRVYSNPNSAQFIHKLDNDLTFTSFSTVIGSGQRAGANMSLTAFLVDDCSNIYLSGWGRRCLPGGGSYDVRGMPITPNAYQSATNGCNFYIIQLSGDADSLLYGTYFGDISANGREHVDGGTSRFDKKTLTVYQSVCAACGGTQGFPTTPGVVSRVNGSSNCNNGSFKMQFDPHVVTAEFKIPSDRGCAPFTITITDSSFNARDYLWVFGDGNFSNLKTPTHTYTDSGTYIVRLITYNPKTCNLYDTAYATIIVFPPSQCRTARCCASSRTAASRAACSG
jgi:hypothetical protein